MIKHLIVDEVWYVPVFEHPWQERLGKWQIESYSHRKKMVKLILSPQTHLREYLDISYAYPTLLWFANNYPQHNFSWIIGADNLASFGDWDYYQRIIDEFGVYVYPRAGFALQTDLVGLQLLHDFPKIQVSSTLVKKKLQAGEAVKGLVSQQVEAYIKQHGLYAG
jgi:nicotinate-nucleotide adenylyltransferase